MSACETCQLTRFERGKGGSFCIKTEASIYQLQAAATAFTKVPQQVDVEVCDHPDLREPIKVSAS